MSFREEENVDRDTQEDGHVKTEAGIRVTLPQAKEYLGPPESRRAKGAWPSMKMEIKRFQM